MWDLIVSVPDHCLSFYFIYILFLNDMKISISLESKLFLNAVDGAILFSHKDPEVISRKLGSQLESCSKWLIDNKLSLHMGTNECILSISKRKLRKVNDFSIEYNRHTIKTQNSVKYLRLDLDNLLAGETIVNNIVQKVNARL